MYLLQTKYNMQTSEVSCIIVVSWWLIIFVYSFTARRPETWRHSGGAEAVFRRWQWQNAGCQVGDVPQGSRAYRPPSSAASEAECRWRSGRPAKSRHADHVVRRIPGCGSEQGIPTYICYDACEWRAGGIRLLSSFRVKYLEKNCWWKW